MFLDTIVAVATPPGAGGVGIVRISGPDALSFAKKINGNKSLKPREALFSSFYNTSSELIDKGLILYFEGPNSFTGEDVIELHAHGSPIVLDILVKEVISHGARIAEPGEFTKRAFLNDKMDLTQAEAVASLINATSANAARMTLNSLQGAFSKAINQLNEKIIYLRMYVEAAIDFPEEEIDFLHDGNVSKKLDEIIKELHDISAKAAQGSLIQEGLSLVIAGRPNAGKSTLINNLARKDVAIVTEIAGTTRDVLREQILLDDIPLHIIDTAGLRQSTDVVEQEGIKRTWTELKKADCVLLVVALNEKDKRDELFDEIKATLDNHVPIITVFNKIDLVDKKPLVHTDEVYLSAKSGNGIEALKTLIKNKMHYHPYEGQFLARRRHLTALKNASDTLILGKKQLNEHRAGELLAEDLRCAHRMLGEITGEFSSDDLLGEIFSSFCIGK